MSTSTARSYTSAVPPLVSLIAGLALLAVPVAAHAADGGGQRPSSEALNEVKGKRPQVPVIQNRFFLKEGRFEIAPVLGYVPNNAFVSVPIGGALFAYHFGEAFAVEGGFYYAPNTGAAGVKNLTATLVNIAYSGDNASFQQPLDRPQLGAVFDARWTPIYGKINLIGERVINFDFYGDVGLGFLAITNDSAVLNQDWVDGVEGASMVQLEANPETHGHPAVPIGIGLDFFLTQSVAIKLDARSLLYVAPEPDYGTGETLNPKLYNTFVTTAGVSIFVPKMKPRLYNF